jgi:hypothetical protein
MRKRKKPIALEDGFFPATLLLMLDRPSARNKGKEKRVKLLPDVKGYPRSPAVVVTAVMYTLPGRKWMDGIEWQNGDDTEGE